MQLFDIVDGFLLGHPDHQIVHKMQIFQHVRNGKPVNHTLSNKKDFSLWYAAGLIGRKGM